jgi:hypothetical protein
LDREVPSLALNVSVEKVVQFCGLSHSYCILLIYSEYRTHAEGNIWVTTAVIVKTTVLCHVTAYTLVRRYWRFFSTFKCRKSALNVEAASLPKRLYPSIKLRHVTTHMIIAWIAWKCFEKDVLKRKIFQVELQQSRYEWVGKKRNNEIYHLCT